MFVLHIGYIQKYTTWFAIVSFLFMNNKDIVFQQKQNQIRKWFTNYWLPQSTAHSFFSIVYCIVERSVATKVTQIFSNLDSTPNYAMQSAKMRQVPNRGLTSIRCHIHKVHLLGWTDVQHLCMPGGTMFLKSSFPKLSISFSWLYMN